MHRIESDNVTVINGKNSFTNGPPGTTLDAEWLNSVQEEICNVITNSGYSISSRTADQHNQLWTVINALNTEYDAIITNQTQFNNIVERVAANQYKISDTYRSIYIKYATGGYACSGGNSFLSGGDTWGYIETNNCVKIECEAGATFDFGDVVGYIEVNTNDAILKNVSVVGSGLVAAAITQSFKLNAYRVRFDNCNTNTRLSNVDFVGFQGSATVLHNITSSYDKCSVYTIDGSDKIYAFKDCRNISNSVIYDIDGTTDDIYGFKTCDNISNCSITDFDTSGSNDIYVFDACKGVSNCYISDIQPAVNQDIYGFNTCYNISNCYIEQLDVTGTGIIYAFKASEQIVSSKITDLDSVTGNIYGFYQCNNMGTCELRDADSTSGNIYGWYDCDEVTSSRTIDIYSDSGSTYGWATCNQITGCIATQIDSNSGNAWGFNTSNQLSGCLAIDIDSVSATATGYDGCAAMSACRATSITGGVASKGFNSCSYGAALYTIIATNGGNDWMDSVDAQITNKVSCPSVFT